MAAISGLVFEMATIFSTYETSTYALPFQDHKPPSLLYP